MQLGTSGWYTRVSGRSIPPWSTHQQADPWHWIFSNSPSIVHLGWYTPNSPCLLLSSCKTQGFRPIPYQRKKMTSLDINQISISSWFYFLIHYETYIPIDFIKLQHWHCHFEHLYYVLLHILIYLCMNWIYCMPNTFLYEKLIDSSRPSKTENFVTYVSSITAGISFFCSCRLKIFPGAVW